MTYSKYNVVYLLQKWMDSVAGQTFLNYAYSWGASVVILGTLFKLTHLPGANFFLFLGMGTEVFVFFISAFDRPFDKTTDGMDLQHGTTTEQQKKQENTVTMVEEQQIMNARQRMLMQDNASPAGQQAMTAMLQQTQQQMQQAQQLSEQLPDNEETAALKKTLTAINEIYKLQLEKAGRQMTTIESIDEQLKALADNLVQLNMVYARMIAAVRQ